MRLQRVGAMLNSGLLCSCIHSFLYYPCVQTFNAFISKGFTREKGSVIEKRITILTRTSSEG